jgi:hypothetical protein
LSANSLANLNDAYYQTTDFSGINPAIASIMNREPGRPSDRGKSATTKVYKKPAADKKVEM